MVLVVEDTLLAERMSKVARNLLDKFATLTWERERNIETAASSGHLMSGSGEEGQAACRIGWLVGE